MAQNFFKVWSYKFNDFFFLRNLVNIQTVFLSNCKVWFSYFDNMLFNYKTLNWKEFEFIGYQYSIKNIARKFFFEIDLGFTFKCLLRRLPILRLRKKKRRFLVYSFDKYYLNSVVKYIEEIHKFPIFKVKGFVFPLKRKKLYYFRESKIPPRRQKILMTFFLTAKYRARFF
jgi:hypothetical protein